MHNGYFITIEGGDGAGKSSAIRFIADYLSQHNIEFIVTREPGGTEIAEKIRHIILEHHQEQMHPITELLLYFASRAQHLAQVIIPALQQGKWVLCDRFTDSTYAYQGAARRLKNEKVAILEQLVQEDLRPNLTILLDIDVKQGFNRVKHKRELDRLESEKEDFHQRVRHCYLEMAKKEPHRFKIVDAHLSPPKVQQQIKVILDEILPISL